MGRRRHIDCNWCVTTTMPNGAVIYKDNLDTIQDIAIYINKEFFSSFSVVSRAMVNNWIYYEKRREFGQRFAISQSEP
tara:strand:- start:1183 stop:1416 length:234 start_codon:yes stop_codon:yes gene_type:complete